MRHNIVGDFARLPRHTYPIAERAVFLSPDPGIGNVLLRWDVLERQLGCRLDPLSRDLCEISTYVYLADKAVARGELDHWSRRLAFLVPVRLPERWNAVKPLLQKTVASLTGDSVAFRFVKRQSQDENAGGAPNPEHFSLVPQAADCVSLFSGGLDSFAGAAYLLSGGRRPAFVGHYANPTLRTLQAELMAGLRRRFDYDGEHLQYRITSRKTTRTRHVYVRRESSHRARSFLFLSFAAVVAAARGLSEIFICENGVLALNIPLSEARQGTRCSRHAHPVYLRHFNDLVAALYGASFEVRNPFLFWTKAEETQLLVEAGLGAAIRETVSCWNYPNLTLHFKEGHHCGFCTPCVVRRLSVAAAGAERHDDRYALNIFGVDRTEHVELRRNVNDLLFFCRCFAREPIGRLVYRFPDLVGIEAAREDVGEDKLRAIMRVYKSFATATLPLFAS